MNNNQTKLNLECGEDAILGYLNIENKPTSKLSMKGDFKNLNSLGIQDGTIEEIRGNDCLKFVNLVEVHKVIGHWHSKLKHGGRLTLSSIDAEIIGLTMGYSQAPLDDINIRLFGTPNGEPYRALYSLSTMESFLQRFGFKTIEKSINGINFYIEVEKS